jgi:predicted DsbA family dithiol-disulfide isomerase
MHFANTPKASPEQLKAYAQEVGLDVAAFEPCLSSGKCQASVQRDSKKGTRAGVTGSRGFCMNDRVVSGASRWSVLCRSLRASWRGRGEG